MSRWSWESNPQYLAQVGHSLGGAWIVFLTGMFWGEHAMLGAGVALAVCTALKEFVWDVAPPPFGEGDSWADSAMDWAFWCVGGVAGLGVFALATHLHRLVSP